MVLEGKYKIEKEENTVEYFKAAGMPQQFAEHLAKMHTYVTIESNGNEYTVGGSDGQDKPSKTRKYVIGAEFEEPAGEGQTMKSTFVVEDGKLVITSIWPDGSKSKRWMEPTPNGMLHVFTGEKIPIICKRYMVKI